MNNVVFNTNHCPQKHRKSSTHCRKCKKNTKIAKERIGHGFSVWKDKKCSLAPPAPSKKKHDSTSSSTVPPTERQKNPNSKQKFYPSGNGKPWQQTENDKQQNIGSIKAASHQGVGVYTQEVPKSVQVFGIQFDTPGFLVYTRSIACTIRPPTKAVKPPPQPR